MSTLYTLPRSSDAVARLAKPLCVATPDIAALIALARTLDPGTVRNFLMCAARGKPPLAGISPYAANSRLAAGRGPYQALLIALAAFCADARKPGSPAGIGLSAQTLIQVDSLRTQAAVAQFLLAKDAQVGPLVLRGFLRTAMQHTPTEGGGSAWGHSYRVERAFFYLLAVLRRNALAKEAIPEPLDWLPSWAPCLFNSLGGLSGLELFQVRLALRWHRCGAPFTASNFERPPSGTATETEVAATVWGVCKGTEFEQRLMREHWGIYSLSSPADLLDFARRPYLEIRLLVALAELHAEGGALSSCSFSAKVSDLTSKGALLLSLRK